MTISTQTFRFRYTSTGASTLYPYTNKILNQDDLKVYVNSVLKTVASDYSVTGVGETTGGNVSFVINPALAADVLITKDGVEFTQETDYVENDAFPAESHEDALDKLTNLAQKIWDYTRRSVKLAITSTLTDLEMPTPAASKLIGWNSTATALENYSLIPLGSISDDAYNSTTWDNVTDSAPSKNAIRDKIETLTTQVAVQNQAYSFAEDAEASDAYIISPTPAVTALTNGMRFSFIAKTLNTGAATLQVSSLAAKDIRKNYNAALVTGDILAGQVVEVVYDSTNDFYQMVSGLGTITEVAFASASEALAGLEPAKALAPLTLIIPNWLTGLALSNDAGDTSHDIAIASGWCMDSANAFGMYLPAAMTKKADASWAAGDDAGGLFAGGLSASTWYHTHLIRKDSDGSIDAGFDTSVTAANKPVGYSNYRRIGSVLTDGSANIIQFVQTGDWFEWLSYPVDSAFAAPGTTNAVSKTLSTPLGVVTRALISVYYTAGAAYYYIVSALNTTDTAAGRDYSNGMTPASLNAVSNIQVYTNTSSQIRIRFNRAEDDYRLQTYGYFDTRGKD